MAGVTTRLPRSGKKQHGRLFLAASAVLVSFCVKGFCPTPIRHNLHQDVVPSSYLHHRRTWLAISSKPENTNENKDGGADDSPSSSIIIHTTLRESDKEWYQEYVSDMLGEDYCSDRWPSIVFSGSTKQEEKEKANDAFDEEELTMTIDQRISAPISVKVDTEIEESLPVEASAETATPSTKTKTIENVDDDPEETGDEIEEDVKSKTEDSKQRDNVLVDEGDEEKTSEDRDELLLPVIEMESPSKDAVQETLEAPSKDETDDSDSPSTETDSTTTTKSSAAEVVDSEQTEEEIIAEIESEKETTKETGEPKAVVSKDETRAMVYRNITGKRMTCVPLSDLLELGYAVSELERIQAEFLSIVVLDQRKCPSMGIPSLWKIKDPKAKAEIKLIDSMEEAFVLVDKINEKEREEQESIQQRRQRQEGRKEGTTNDPTASNGGESRTRRRAADRPRTLDRDGRNPVSRRNPGRGGTSPSDPERRQYGRGEERRRRGVSGDYPRDRGRQPRQRRGGVDRDGNPRKIYKVPRDDTRSSSQGRDDPPDPGSPIWVDMDTFRDLLQKEADFRMNLIGDDWSEVIEQENDWRTNLYKGWLWTLNNGVGESIVPPSRYDRARRNQRKRTPQDPPPPNQRQRRTTRTPPPGDNSQQQQTRRQRRRPKDDAEVPLPEQQRRQRRESRLQRRERGGDAPQSRSQRQQQGRPGSKRTSAAAPRDPAVLDDDEVERQQHQHNNDPDNVPISAEERRSRRRAERRRGPPGNES